MHAGWHGMISLRLAIGYNLTAHEIYTNNVAVRATYPSLL